MKKILLFLGILISANNLFSMEIEHQPIKPIIHNDKLSRWEKVKVSTALAGCAFFSFATLLNRDTLARDTLREITNSAENKPNFSLRHHPTIISLIPAVIGYGIIFQTAETPPLTQFSTIYNISACYTAALALLCGRYAYKKLTQSKIVRTKKVIIS